MLLSDYLSEVLCIHPPYVILLYNFHNGTRKTNPAPCMDCKIFSICRGRCGIWIIRMLVMKYLFAVLCTHPPYRFLYSQLSEWNKKDKCSTLHRLWNIFNMKRSVWNLNYLNACIGLSECCVLHSSAISDLIFKIFRMEQERQIQHFA